MTVGSITLLKPGKGLRILATHPGVLDGLQQTMFEVLDSFEYEEPIAALIECWEEWGHSKDSFGSKATKVIQAGDTEIRVSLIYTDRGDYKLDIREWYQD